MKVLYDHQTFSLQKFGGISRTVAEIIKSSRLNKSVEIVLPILFSNNIYLKQLCNLNYPKFLPLSTSNHAISAMFRLNSLYTIPYLKKSDFDVFHPSYYDPYFLKHLKGKPFVVTFMDLIHEKYGSRFKELSADKYIVERKRTMLKNASKIIAISECTKRDIVDFFGTSEEKIEVIYLGSSLEVTNNSTSQSSASKNYLLYVGNRSLYKNFSFCLNAIAPLLLGNKDLKIICAGGGNFNKTEIELISTLKIGNKVEFVRVENDDTLVSLYSNALCFIFPSLYEGFGIPVLEAFSCGCPVVLSDKGSLPEVGGNAAVYCDPDDADSISAAVESYIKNSSLRDENRRKGYERLKKFSWAKTSEETFNLYKTLI
ncbi:MAG: hypothetical protein JWQ40_4063 [Segetibacter sp.]|jgi:glycosyltransferase involved in cell wall biosynthesis|nr:hypothetical protein [Segetibacter sp.]